MITKPIATLIAALFTGRGQAVVAAVTGLALLAALALHLLGVPLIGVSRGGVHGIRDALLVFSSIVAGVPIALKAYRAARAKAFSIDLLVTIAVVGALVIGEYVEAAVVSFLFVFGAWLEARTLEKSRRSLRELVDLAPQEALVLRDGDTVTVRADELAAGETMVVHSGGTIAADGTITTGSALVSEAAITGEPLAVSKSVGDTVYGGTILDRGYLEIVADQVGQDTTFAKIIELVEEAQETKTRAQRFLDRFAGIYTPAIIVLSVLVLILTRNVEFALTFLVIACPGALVISTPVSMVAGLGNGARHGVLMKGGDALERLSKVDTIVFDKTGTLTQGRPRVTDVTAFGAFDADEVLRLAAGLELASEHPLGRTIVDAARERGLSLPNRPDDVDVVKGGGIRGFVDGRRITVGSPRMLGGVLDATRLAIAQERERLGNTAVVVTIDDRPAAVVSIADELRPDAAAAIGSLRAKGVRQFVMLTGDNRHTARLVADQLGIDRVEAELLPQDKVRVVTELREAGHRVAMIGDGINDAPAIATADIGIAMGAGTDVSIQTADVILMANRFDQLVHGIALAKATVRNMKQNTVVAVGTVVALLTGVLLQVVFMSTGMLVHEISVLVVILNAVRLVRFRVPGSTTGTPHGPPADEGRRAVSAEIQAEWVGR